MGVHLLVINKTFFPPHLSVLDRQQTLSRRPAKGHQGADAERKAMVQQGGATSWLLPR